MRDSTPPASAGHVFQFIRSGVATTRPELARLTGLSRTAITQRVNSLIELGVVVEKAAVESTGGRPPTRLQFNAEAGVVLAADFDVNQCRLAVSTLDGTLLGELAAEMQISLGPDVVLDWVAERFLALLDDVGRAPTDVWGIGIGVPGPVEFSAGRAVSPPIMPGWDGVSIPDRLAVRFPVPVLVDNDVNIMAVGEYATHWRNLTDDLLFVKISSGIGCGMIVSGEIHRGAQGAAGDIGHISVAGCEDIVCNCGNTGCVEAVAGGDAIAAKLRDLGYDCPDARAAGHMVRAGNPDASRLVREAGRTVGAVIASLVNSFNPAVIVVGGHIAAAPMQLIAGIREVVYQRSTALATRGLELVVSRLGERAGVVGAVATVLDDILSPESIDAALAVGQRANGRADTTDADGVPVLAGSTQRSPRRPADQGAAQ